MSAQVSNASAGVGVSRQASAASGAGGGRKDDKRDGRKPPRKGPSRVDKKTAKRCYICREPGHLQKNCPYPAFFRALVDTLSSGISPPQGLQPHAGPGPSRRRRRGRRGPPRADQPRQEVVASQGENQLQNMQVDAPGENGVEQQQQGQQQPPQGRSALPDPSREL